MTEPRRQTATVVADGFTLLEGPRWHDGRLWVSDFFTHRVLRFELDGPAELHRSTVCEVPGRPSGLGFMPDGALRVSSMDDCRLVEVGEDGRLDEVARYDHLVTGPGNDMVIDADGIAIIGNFGVEPSNPRVVHPTSLIRVSAGGEVAVLVDDIVFPNGMVIADGVLYVAETYRARITAFDYAAGITTNRRTWYQFPADPAAGQDGQWDIPAITGAISFLPDGIDRDGEGALWIANAIGHPMRVTPEGDITDVVDTGALGTYAVALGGEDGRDLYLCCAPPAESFDPSTTTRSVLMHVRLDVGR